MTAHADIHAGNACFGPLIHADVTERARQTLGEMHGMSVGDRLHRMFRMDVEKILYGVHGSGMRSGEDTRGHVFGWPRRACLAPGEHAFYQCPGEEAGHNHQQANSPTHRDPHKGTSLKAFSLLLCTGKCGVSLFLRKRHAGFRTSVYTKSEALLWNCGSVVKLQMLHESETVVNNEE